MGQNISGNSSKTSAYIQQVIFVHELVVFGDETSLNCKNAIALLEDYELRRRPYFVSLEEVKKREKFQMYLEEISGEAKGPWIFLCQNYIGSWDALALYHNNQRLEEILEEAGVIEPTSVRLKVDVTTSDC